MSVWLALTVACGGASASGETTPEPEEPSEPQPLEQDWSAAEPGPVVDLVLRDSGGNFFDLADYRGRPTLIFFFTTFDTLSQAAIRPVQRFQRDTPDCRVLGVAVQPDAGPFLEVYRSSLQPGYRLSFDPNGVIAGGSSALGHLPGVPMFVMLDTLGRVIGTKIGFPNTRTLETLFAEAAAAAPFFEPRQPPLMGQPHPRD